jgi:radical SAM superfamily enzyme YgiQ (UPF0313 family)
MNSSLNYLKYYLVDNGYRVEVHDCAFLDEEYEEIIKIIGVKEKPIIGITGYSRERFNAYKLIRKIRKEIPDALIVVGGRHFGFLAKETLESLPEVDLVVKGAGEVAFKEIVDHALSDEIYSQIAGVVLRASGGKILEIPAAKVPKFIDHFRNYDKEDYKKQKTGRSFKSKVDKKNEYFNVFAIRGCPFQCIFCSLTSQKVQFRDIESVLDEIEEKIEITGLKHMRFPDSSFTINKKYTEKLCRRMIERGIKVKWGCYSRVDIPYELVKVMAEAGCISLEVALESGSEKVLKTIKKKIDVEQYKTFVKWAHGLGMKIWVFTMMSFPDETPEEVDMTLEVMKETAPYVYEFGLQVARILPDASLYPIAVQRGALPKDFNWFDEKYAHFQSQLNKTADYDTIPLYIDSMSEETLVEKLKEYESIKLEYYTQPEIFWDGVRQELSIRKLKKLTIAEFFRKCKVGAKMAITVTKKSMFHDRRRYSPASQSSLGI